MTDKQTYKTIHPIIKEITIGDVFVTECGLTCELIEYRGDVTLNTFVFHVYEFERFNDPRIYLPLTLNWDNQFVIKRRHIPIKDKLNLL